MEMSEISYCKSTPKDFQDAVVSVLQQVEKKGWSVFGIYDLQERLAAKGFCHEEMKVVEICSAKHADKFLSRNRMAALCMPCRIAILRQDNAVRIAGMRPAFLSQFFPEVAPDETVAAEADIRDIIDGAA
jgi:uncharacterized protein (DUF302 family)